MKTCKNLLLLGLSIFAIVSCASNSTVMGDNVPNENNTSLDNSMSAPTIGDINLN